MFFSCKEITNEENSQEERFFRLYMHSNYGMDLESDDKFYYIENKPGTGANPDSDDWIILNYVGYTIPEDLVVDTYIENVARDNDIYESGAWYGPFKMQNGSRTEGLKQGLMKMKEGGEATICFTSELGYGSTVTNLMKSVTAYKSLKYEVKLIKVIEDIEVYEEERLEAYVADIPGTDTIHDPDTDAIMYYVVDEENEGTTIANDSVVTVNYKGYTLDGVVFDESQEGDPFELTVGDDAGAIKGWNLGLLRFKEGEKGRLFIPYQLAYGESGQLLTGTNYFSILPYEQLVFEIEVVEVSQTDITETD